MGHFGARAAFLKQRCSSCGDVQTPGEGRQAPDAAEAAGRFLRPHPTRPKRNETCPPASRLLSPRHPLFADSPTSAQAAVRGAGRLPITPSPRGPVSPSPRRPVSPLPGLPVTPFPCGIAADQRPRAQGGSSSRPWLLWVLSTDQQELDDSAGAWAPPRRPHRGLHFKDTSVSTLKAKEH